MFSFMRHREPEGLADLRAAAALPPMDLLVPEGLETATFANG